MIASSILGLTLACLAPQEQSIPRPMDPAGLLGALVYMDISVEFRDKPVREAFEYLQVVLEVPFIVRSSDDPSGDGIDPETRITLSARATPALTILERLLDACASSGPCTWQLRDGAIEVGTKTRLGSQEALERRVYPITDLLFEIPDKPAEALNVDPAPAGVEPAAGAPVEEIDPVPNDPSRKARRARQLVQLIRQTVEPEQWKGRGGLSTIACWLRGNADTLVVVAPDFVHRGIDGYPFEPRRPVVAMARRVSYSASGTLISGAEGGPPSATPAQ